VNRDKIKKEVVYSKPKNRQPMVSESCSEISETLFPQFNSGIVLCRDKKRRNGLNDASRKEQTHLCRKIQNSITKQR